MSICRVCSRRKEELIQLGFSFTTMQEARMQIPSFTESGCRHNLKNGFAHYYVAQDGTLQVEDDINHAWHCGDTKETTIICQLKSARVWVISIFSRAMKEKAQQLAAQKCKQYGIEPENLEHN